MAQHLALEIAQKFLYEDIDKIPEFYRNRIVRIRAGHMMWYEFPSKSRMEIRNHLVKTFGVSVQMAYEDINVIEQLLGNIKRPAKEWVLFRVNSMLEQAFTLAETQKDPKAMAIVADKMGKFNQLDQQDPERIPFDQIVPQQFEPTEDPSVLGITRDPKIREKKQALLEKYSAEIEITDVPYTELPEDAETSPEESIL